MPQKRCEIHIDDLYFIQEDTEVHRSWVNFQSLCILSELTRLLSLWGFSRQEHWSGLPFPPPGDLPNAGIKPRCPLLQADCLPAEPQGKPKNTGVGNLSLLLRIFPTQELNWGLLHCRRILLPAELPGKPEQAQ